jgi:hypothetical protein
MHMGPTLLLKIRFCQGISSMIKFTFWFHREGLIYALFARCSNAQSKQYSSGRMGGSLLKTRPLGQAS